MGRRVFRGPTPITDPGGSGKLVLPWAVENQLDVCKGMRLWVDVRVAAPDITPFQATQVAWTSAEQLARDPHPMWSGDRSGVPFEGPFWMYQIRTGKEGGVPRLAGLYEPSDRGCNTFFFDLQCKRPVLLPYDGTLSLIGQYPGTWEFNFAVLSPFLDGEWGKSPLDAQTTLTLGIAQGALGGNPSFRNMLGVPPGAHGYTQRDSETGTGGGVAISELAVASSPVRGVGGPGYALFTSYEVQDPMGQSGQFGQRVGVANAARINHSACLDTSQGLVTYHVSFL